MIADELLEDEPKPLGRAKSERVREFIQVHEDHVERARRPSEQIVKRTLHHLPDGAAPVKSRVLIHEAEVARAKRPLASFWRSDLPGNVESRRANAEDYLVMTPTESRGASDSANGQQDTDNLPYQRTPASMPRCVCVCACVMQTSRQRVTGPVAAAPPPNRLATKWPPAVIVRNMSPNSLARAELTVEALIDGHMRRVWVGR
jgi:hypothetical protein